MERKLPIVYIGETFEYLGIIHATVLDVSKNYFTNEYVYKIRRDHFFGTVDEAWYAESQVLVMKGFNSKEQQADGIVKSEEEV
jgi:hypothetical protein